MAKGGRRKTLELEDSLAVAIDYLFQILYLFIYLFAFCMRHSAVAELDGLS